jgi:ADP-ribose pyrophosphatase YjhB (NUDIX family)
VLLFLERGGRWLFLEGGPAKWFAGRLNGLGGSVERGEDARSAALREAREECGLAPSVLRLAAVVHVATGTGVITMTDVRRHPRPEGAPAPVGVLLFVFVGKLPPGPVRGSAEGRLVWRTSASLRDPEEPFLDDVRSLLPQVARRPAGAPPLFLTSNA